MLPASTATIFTLSPFKKETSIISKIYTEEFGLQSYIINGIRSKNSKTKISAFQPLSLLDMVVSMKKNFSLGYIKEIKFDFIFMSNHQNQKKISICLFLSEVLIKLINYQIDDAIKYYFVRNSLIELDTTKNNFENFHLQFLVKFSKYLGFEITNIEDFSNVKFEDKKIILFLSKIIKSDYSSLIKSTSFIRNKALDIIINYFSEKTEIKLNLNSHSVLHNLSS